MQNTLKDLQCEDSTANVPNDPATTCGFSGERAVFPEKAQEAQLLSWECINILQQGPVQTGLSEAAKLRLPKRSKSKIPEKNSKAYG